MLWGKFCLVIITAYTCISLVEKKTLFGLRALTITGTYYHKCIGRLEFVLRVFNIVICLLCSLSGFYIIIHNIYVSACLFMILCYHHQQKWRLQYVSVE